MNTIVIKIVFWNVWIIAMKDLECWWRDELNKLFTCLTLLLSSLESLRQIYEYCYNSEIVLVTAFLFGQSSWIQNAYFLVENCYLPNYVRRNYAFWTSRRSKVALKSDLIKFGSAHGWIGVWTGPKTGYISTTASIFTIPTGDPNTVSAIS